LWPTWTPLAVSSQRRDMAKSSIARPAGWPLGARRVEIQVHLKERRTYKGTPADRQATENQKNSCKVSFFTPVKSFRGWHWPRFVPVLIKDAICR
jgi:hypothetical protein